MKFAIYKYLYKVYRRSSTRKIFIHRLRYAQNLKCMLYQFKIFQPVQ